MASKLKIKVNGHVHSVTASWDIVAFEFTHFGIPGISLTIDVTQGRWFYFASPHDEALLHRQLVGQATGAGVVPVRGGATGPG